MTGEGPRTCPACGQPAASSDRFCEECGADLPTPVTVGAPDGPAPAGVDASAQTSPAARRGRPSAGARAATACRECGGEIDDGWCTTCGAKAPRERDHMVDHPVTWVAAVSDRGIRHHRNEDAMALIADPQPGSRAALVVCDGVSTSADSDVASLAAARAAVAVISAGSVGLAGPGALVGVLGGRIEAAALAAAEAVAATGDPTGDSPPSCTFVAAAVEQDLVVVGVVGDSRAYWLPDDGEPAVLTVDDSVAAQEVAAGRPRAEAEAGPQAHAITRWLGVDSPDQVPRLTTLEVAGPGWLLLCSDGLWNYCSEASAMAATVRAATDGEADDPARDAPAAAAASALVSWATAQGGHDNITVVLARLGTTATGTGRENGELE